MRRGGVAADLLHVTGFPVPAFFGEQTGRLTPPDLTVPGHAPRVLYIINSGTHHATETARRLLAEVSWEVTIAVGRDENLRRELTLLTAGRAVPATILGWTDRIPHLLMTHHVVISKAGGATTQESIAARCPMIVNQIVPGQEEGNYELLRRTGAGALAETPGAVITTLRAAFADRGAQWRQWRTALEPIVRNSAAQVIASHLLAAAPSGVKSSALNVECTPIPAAALS